MADIKNYDPDNGNGGLKKADAEKSFGGGGGISAATSGIIGAKLGELSDREKRKPRKRLPVIVDVIIAVLMLAIVAGMVIGAYFLFKYYTDEYETVDVEYLFIAYVYGDPEEYNTIKNRELYLDEYGNTLFFGKVTELEVIEDENEHGQLILMLSVDADARYMSGVGYSIGINKLAVGSEYLLRSGNISIHGTIVELTAGGANNGYSVADGINSDDAEVKGGN